MASRSSLKYELFTNSLLRRQCCFFLIFFSCFLLWQCHHRYTLIMFPCSSIAPDSLIVLVITIISKHLTHTGRRSAVLPHHTPCLSLIHPAPVSFSSSEKSFSGFPLTSVKVLTAFCLVLIQTFLSCLEKPYDKLVLYSFSWWNISSKWKKLLDHFHRFLLLANPSVC